MATYPTEARESGEANHDSESNQGGEKQQARERSIGVVQSDLLRRAGQKWVIAAFVGLYLFTFVDTFNKYSTITYAAYATSEFSNHSLLSASRVVGTIAGLLSYPIVARLSDMFGRFEMFSFSIFLSVLSLVLLAACQNIETYFVGNLFDSISGVGFGITQQVFIADLTNLRNRGFWLTLPELISAVPTLFLGTIVAQAFLDHSTWRWGYGMWAVVTPVVATPLLLTLLIRKIKDRKLYPEDITRPRVLREIHSDDPFHRKVYQLLWVELDLPGCILLIASLALVLVPVSLTGARNSGAWNDNGGFIAMVVIGGLLFIGFIVWDYFFAKKPFVPFRLIRDRTIIAACLLCVLDFMHFAFFNVFFASYLQVAGHYSPGHATRIDNSLRVAFQIVSMISALGMRYTKRAKPWVLIGAPLCLLGQGLMIYFVNMDGDRVGSEVQFIVARVLVGAGRGLYQTAAQVAVQAVVTRHEVAIVTGVFYASMNLGGAIGTSVSGAIWRANLVPKLMEYMPDATQAQANAVFGSIVVAREYAAGTAERVAIDLAYRETQELLAIGSTAILAPMVLIMWFVKNVDLSAKQRDGLEAQEPEEVQVQQDRKSDELTEKSGNAAEKKVQVQAL